MNPLRRQLLSLMSIAPTLAVWPAGAASAAGTSPATSTMSPATPRLTLTDAQWRQRLSPAAYDVLRHEATERAHSSPLNHEKRPGSFHCAGCDQALFTQAMKFDSGTGWPSFFTSLPGAFETRRDFRLILPRTEYHCSRCGGHHGHVFNDGPPPTGQRWCNNGVALRFEAALS